MRKQSYSNHRRHKSILVILFVLVVVTGVGSVINVIQSIEKPDQLNAAILLVAINIILIVSFFFLWGAVLRTQDRAIRAEENFRHYIITGKPLDPRLHATQIIALRFAPDDEFIALAKEAAEKQLTSDEIKKSIKRWKGDYGRA